MSGALTAPLTHEDGVRAVELARDSVESFVLHGRREQPGSMRDAFYARTGAYVRLTSTRGMGQLRGCAGTYRGRDQLGHAIVDAAIEAASDTSAGSEVGPAELQNLNVSVWVVAGAEPTDDPASDLEIGRHGVAVQNGDRYGWLYPTVPMEHGWSNEEYLTRVCRKARLPPLAWQDEDTTVTLIHGQIFQERTDGTVEER